MRVAALAGGVGAAKLLCGLQKALTFTRPPERPWREPDGLTAIVNTGDDARIYGVHVSPDVDIVTYWLAGIADTERGWGLRDDAFTVLEALGALGSDTWFKLGDRDFATCVYRTERLRAGATLSAVTDEIRRALGVRARILPMSDDPVATTVATVDGRRLEFQEYFVRLRNEPDIAGVEFTGIADAKAGPGVLEAIETADAVVVCPSNPVVSIGPILCLPGVRAALVAHPKVVAISPIVAGRAVKGPADRMLEALGHEPAAPGVARMYADFCDKFVLDAQDAHLSGDVHALGIETIALDTIMTDHDAAVRLARAMLGMGEQ